MEIKSNKLILIILILAPYIYLFPHTFNFIEMGNDFELLYFSYKKYIFEFIKSGHFPLWSPSESLGYSLIFNPFAQYFYPPSWLLYLAGIIIGDLSKNTYLLYTIFGLSIYNIGQYIWLRQLNIDKKYCLLATLITCFGLKLTEILRFPNAIHAFAWFPWILYSITLTVKESSFIKSSIIIFLSTIMILTAGYPYYILYGLILFSFYFIFINLPFIQKEFFNSSVTDFSFKSFLNCLFPALMGFLIVLPWFLGIQEIMEITRDRNLKDIAFSYTLSSSVLDQIGSWILPPISFAESNYYFGAITTLIIFYYFIFFISGKINEKKEKFFTIFFLIFFIFNYQIAASENSFLFKILWNNFDFLQNFRAFGRINILLVPLIAVLICFSIKNFEKQKINLNYFIFLFATTIVIIITQYYLIEVLSAKSLYWETWQEKRINFSANQLDFFSKILKSYNNYIYSFFFILAFIFLFFSKNFKNNLVFYFGVIIFVISELFFLSNIQWAIPYKYYDDNNYNTLNKNPKDDLRLAFKKSNIISEVKGNTYYRNNKSFNLNYFDQFGIDVHTRLIDKYFNRNGTIKNNNGIDKVKFFWGMDQDSRKVFFSKTISANTIPELVDNIKDSEKNSKSKIIIEFDKYNGDRIHINVFSETDGYIIFVDNWSPGWKATVDEKSAKIYKVLNSYKSVKIKNGRSKIIFKYEPW